MTRYRGRHRAPSLTDTFIDNSGRIAAATLTTGLLTGIAVTPAQAAETNSTLDAIAVCESGNDADVSGPVTSAGGHFGLFQFDLPTWRSVGGKGNPADASVAEQYKRAQMLLDKRGTQPWDASKNCWRGKIGDTKSPTASSEGKRSNGRTADQSDTGKRRAGTSIPDGYVVRSGDTLNKLASRFDVEGGSTAIAKANGIKNPDLIFVGQTLN